MRRYFGFVIAACFVFLTSCTLPVDNGIQPTEAMTSSTGETVESGDATEVTPDGSNDNSRTGNNAGDDTGSSQAKARMPVTLYYQDADGYLVPMARWIDKQPGIASAAVRGLIDSAINREELQYFGLYPVLPVNSDILGISIKDETATVDFNKNILEYENADIEKNIVASVVYTLTEFSTIKNVRILVNGYTAGRLKYGTDVSMPLSRDSLPINSKIADGTSKALIYCFKRANEGFTYLLPVSVDVGAAEEINAGTLVKLLLNGVTDEKIQSEMPADTELKDFSVKNGVLTLDFTEGFLNYGGNAREEGILKQLAYTVRQLKGTNLMKITVNGESAQLPEGTDISSGLAIPKTINDVIDN